MTGPRRQMAIDVSSDAWAQMTEIADRATPIETGGILLGYRSGRSVQVLGAAEVTDPDANETSFMLRRDAAQARLDEIRNHFPEGSPVGFVGDWHVHPRNSPPSSVDRRSITRLGRHYRRRVVSIVVVRERASWVPHGLVATWTRSRACPVRLDDLGAVE